MPELPEVETTRRGLAPLTEGRSIHRLDIRQRRLRWPVPRSVRHASGQRVRSLERRAKWLIWRLDTGSLLWHLGMSGSFRAWNDVPPAGPHDHVDIHMQDGPLIRFTDPRRFGALLWQAGPDPLIHARLSGLGPEPLGAEFDGDYLWRASRGRRAPVKAFIMDARVVAGVGNIYATESLFAAGIHPLKAAGRIGRARYHRLAAAVQAVLARAIAAGGTTLRDFSAGDGTPGYFALELAVYGRAGAACPSCGNRLASRVIAQRNTFYCTRCQR